MDSHQPSTNQINEVMQCIRVRHAIDGRIDGEGKKEYVADVSSPGRYTRDHLPASESFHENKVGHYGQDVVV